MTKPNERKKTGERNGCGRHINFFLPLIFSHFLFFHASRVWSTIECCFLFFSHRRIFFCHILSPFVFYRSSRTYSHIQTQSEFVDNLQVAQGSVCVLYRVDPLIYTYARSCVRTHCLWLRSFFSIFFLPFLRFLFLSCCRFDVVVNSSNMYTW